MKSLTCAFIGLGLIGGSIAKSIKHHNPDTTLMAYDTNQQAVLTAKQEGLIDYALLSLDETMQLADHTTCYCLSQCDIIFLCAPVSINNDNLVQLKDYISPETIITDVGSVKTGIYEQIKALNLTQQFIGGHPMTGSEKSGFAHAQEIILENAYYILTPTEDVSKDKVNMLQNLVATTGALPIILDAKNHDYITAGISHVPHLIAASLVNLVKDSDSTDGYMKMLAAGGFKDITRIASSSPEMWQAICMANPENISQLLGHYITSLTQIKQSIDTSHWQDIYSLFDTARTYRDSFADTANGPIKKTYVCYVDIPDETGSIATLATILATHAISMKNIGIIHNREFEEGVLRVEFYDEASKLQAIPLLEKLQYTIFDRK